MSGYGVHSSKFIIMGRLSDHTSIFTTELYAIYTAIKYIVTLNGKYIILSDSLSCIKALQSLNSSKHFLLSYIKSELDKITTDRIYID